MNLEERLISFINENMSLDELIEAFEKMCKLSAGIESPEEDVKLFETGIFTFTGERLFYFSLVRQFPNEEEEYYQVHLDVLFKPDDRNSKLSTSIWDDEIESDFFEYVRKSDDYLAVKNSEIEKVNVYMDET